MNYSEKEDGFDRLLDLVTLWNQRRWVMLALSTVICLCLAVLFLCLGLVDAVCNGGRRFFSSWGGGEPT